MVWATFTSRGGEFLYEADVDQLPAVGEDIGLPVALGGGRVAHRHWHFREGRYLVNVTVVLPSEEI